MMRCLGAALAAFALLSSAPPPVSSSQADGLPDFKIGLLGEAEDCRSRDDLSGQSMAAYVNVMEERLGRNVLICGVSETNAIAKLEAGEVDFAFVTISDPADAPDSIRPVLSWRTKGELPRARYLGVALNEEAANAPSKSATVIGYSADEVRRGIALRDGLFSDMPAAKDSASAYLADVSQPLSNKAPNVDPTAIATSLAAAGPDAAFIMAEGRFDIFCAVKKQACANLVASSPRFAPIHQAFAVRSDLPGTLRYRLIGIHVQMHHRFRDAFDALAPAGAFNLEPTEPTAFGTES
ncbi:MAG: hypothetical protein AAFR64_07205 [Pseudomonadota bacterium]